MSLSETQVSTIVERIMARLDGAGAATPVVPTGASSTVGEPASIGEGAEAGRRAAREALAAGRGSVGVYATADQAIASAAKAARQAEAMPLSGRHAVVAAMRAACAEVNQHISAWAVAETGLGRVEDKLRKNPLLYEKTPGPEILEPRVFTGDDGLTLVERAPFGVIAAITPTTNPTETVICNAIAMVSGGNAVVFNAHPAAAQVSNFMVDVLGRAIVAAGGPADLVTTIAAPTIESAQALMSHPGVRLLVVTGGPGVVKAAMQSGKKVIAAGPGNPPAVVDDTADLARAARDIVRGATLDNNIVCIAEKEIVAVESIADRLKQELSHQPVREVTGSELAALEKLLIVKRPGPGAPHGAINRKFVGKNAGVILEEIGIAAGPELRMVLADVGPDHPFVQMELMMPVVPLVRQPDVDRAIAFAVEVEHGCRHTASMHSRNVEALSAMARIINTSIFVKNGPTYAGCGLDGEGYTSFTIASPTGEGLTTAVNFTRERRCTLKDSFRIV